MSDAKEFGLHHYSSVSNAIEMVNNQFVQNRRLRKLFFSLSEQRAVVIGSTRRSFICIIEDAHSFFLFFFSVAFLLAVKKIKRHTLLMETNVIHYIQKPHAMISLKSKGENTFLPTMCGERPI